MKEDYQMFTIYGLVDPRTIRIHYVGVTGNHPSVRLKEHLELKGNAPQKNAWLAELKQLELVPSIVILEHVKDKVPAYARERAWIQAGKKLGWPLTNQPTRNRHTTGIPTPSEAKPKSATDEQGKWYEWVKAYMAKHPRLYEEPPHGVRTMARAMAVAETGDAEQVGRYVGIASQTAKAIRDARTNATGLDQLRAMGVDMGDVMLPGGEKLGTDVTMEGR